MQEHVRWNLFQSRCLEGEIYSRLQARKPSSGIKDVTQQLKKRELEAQVRSLLERMIPVHLADIGERLRALEARVAELEKRIDQRSKASPFTQVSSLGMPGYTVQKPIPVTIYQDGEEFTATFFDANISTGGDTEQEAVANLQNLIADFYDELAATPDGQLGPSLQRQKLVLMEFVCRT